MPDLYHIKAEHPDVDLDLTLIVAAESHEQAHELWHEYFAEDDLENPDTDEEDAVYFPGPLLTDLALTKRDYMTITKISLSGQVGAIGWWEPDTGGVISDERYVNPTP